MNSQRKKKGISLAVWNKDAHDLCYQHSVEMGDYGKVSNSRFADRRAMLVKLGYTDKGAYEMYMSGFPGTVADAAKDYSSDILSSFVFN